MRKWYINQRKEVSKLPITEEIKVTAPVQKEWTAVPEDVYQVVIKDIVEKDVKAWEGDQMETKYLFKYVILSGEVPHKGQMLTDFAYPKWFSGASERKMSPSKLVTIFKAIYGFYFPDIKVDEIPVEQVTSLVNTLIGTQIRVNVKVREDEQNKITDYLVIKEELGVSEDIKIAETGKKVEDMTEEEVKEEMSKDPAKEFEKSLNEK